MPTSQKDSETAMTDSSEDLWEKQNKTVTVTSQNESNAI